MWFCDWLTSVLISGVFIWVYQHQDFFLATREVIREP